jgi:hypothetical protein
MNGAAIALSIVDPPAAPAKPIEPLGLEQRIEAAASAAVAISCAMADFADNGRLATGIKERWADRALAEVAELQFNHFGEFDFDRVARREGRRVVELRHGAMLRSIWGRRRSMSLSTICSAIC